MRNPSPLILCLSIACSTVADEAAPQDCADGYVLQTDGYCYEDPSGDGARLLDDEDEEESSDDDGGSGSGSNSQNNGDGGSSDGANPGNSGDGDTSVPPAGSGGDGRTTFTVDDSCGTTDYGYASPSADAREAIERTNCFRNLMGLEPGILHPVVDQATQAHADYMGRHDTISHYEERGKAGYTGDAVWDRLETAGYPLEPGNSWAEVVAYGYGPADAIDGWMETVYHRIPYTTPYWREAGYGQNGQYSAMSFVSPYPNGPRTAVIYPVDGQRDVPLDFDSDIEWPDPAPDHGVVGYPITLTVAANSATDGDNPYGLVVLDATLTDDTGREIDCIVSDPDDDEYLSNTAFMLPLSPMSRGTTYTATMVVEWDGIEETITATFTTAS